MEDLGSIAHTPSCGLCHTPAPLGCFHTANPVLSLGLSSEAWVSVSCPLCTSRQASRAGECSEVAQILCAGLSLFCQPQSSCCALFWASEGPFLSQLISGLVKGVYRVREPFVFHSSLPGALIPSWFFFFLSLVTCELSYSFDCMRSYVRVQ